MDVGDRVDSGGARGYNIFRMSDIGKTDSFELLSKVNLNHLLYFWAVGRTGSMTEAARRLDVSQPSVTEQVRTLERRLGTDLLVRGARGVTLTSSGEQAMRFAEEVVGACSELLRALPLTAPGGGRTLIVGAADAVPKIAVRSILSPLLELRPSVPVLVREWSVDQLLAELSLYRIDLVISDSAPEAGPSPIRSFAARTSGTTVYAVPALARRLRRGFPRSLGGAPMLLPSPGTAVRLSLDRWFALHRLRPRVVLEADDRTLLHHFAEAGRGAVPLANVAAADVARRFGLARVGELRGVQEQYFVLMLEREHEHAALDIVRASLSAPDRPGGRAARSRIRVGR
jgi:LysR family transcriptional activator of nhaA